MINWTGGWRKSSRSGGTPSNCVEVAHARRCGLVGVRDGKLGCASPVLVLDAPMFDVFLTKVKAGGYDLA
jgi:hypothetical protein